MQERIFSLLTKEDEVTWQSIIYDLIKKEELDPWNIDISKLTQSYLQRLRQLKEHSFFISGKVILASAILLKLKSHKLDDHLAQFDSQLFPPEENLLEEAEQDMKYAYLKNAEYPPLLIKTPQPRKRQLTINDLMAALEQALEIDEKRRIKRISEVDVIQRAVIPARKVDIIALMQKVYEKITSLLHVGKKPTLTFTELVESGSKQDIVYTFIPLLHLSNQRKIDLDQETAFGEISITLQKEEA